jgi:hypothetical protein
MSPFRVASARLESCRSLFKIKSSAGFEGRELDQREEKAESGKTFELEIETEKRNYKRLIHLCPLKSTCIFNLIFYTLCIIQRSGLG